MRRVRLPLSRLPAAERAVLGGGPLPPGWRAVPFSAHGSRLARWIDILGKGLLGLGTLTGLVYLAATSDIVGRTRAFLAAGDVFAVGLAAVLAGGLSVLAVALLHGCAQAMATRQALAAHAAALRDGRLRFGLVLTDSHLLLRDPDRSRVLRVPRALVGAPTTAMIAQGGYRLPGAGPGGGASLHVVLHWEGHSAAIPATAFAADPIPLIERWRAAR